MLLDDIPHSLATALPLNVASIDLLVILGGRKVVMVTNSVNIRNKTYPECVIADGVFLGPSSGTRSSRATKSRFPNPTYIYMSEVGLVLESKSQRWSRTHLTRPPDFDAVLQHHLGRKKPFTLCNQSSTKHIPGANELTTRQHVGQQTTQERSLGGILISKPMVSSRVEESISQKPHPSLDK